MEGVGIPALGTNHPDRGRPEFGARQSQHRLGDDLGLSRQRGWVTAWGISSAAGADGALLARFKVRGDRLARLEEHFRRYGGGVVLVARFFDGLRQLNGILAGMFRNALGSFHRV